MNDLLGAGWAFPVNVDVRGRIGLARQEHDVEQAIVMILLTAKGQRVMRPEFGCRIHELIFAPQDATTVGLLTHYVKDALGMWEPRIDVLEVKVESDVKASERLLITIRYEIRTTLDERTLVFPFYRIPGEGKSVAGESPSELWG
jgi:phage baseplate assembly protein W